MKKTSIFLVCLLLCGLLTACGGPEQPTDASPAGSVSTLSPAELRRQSYADLLTRLMEDKILPDGTAACDFGPISKEKWESCFVVADVDHDGREELVLSYRDDCTAAQFCSILEYRPETAELWEELSTTPAVVFYDNGIVDALMPHNQSFGDLWPFFREQYEPESDTYRFVADVRSWDREIRPEDYPEWVDTSGSGSVYYISEKPPQEQSDPEPVDQSVYEQWEADTLQGAKTAQIDFLPLNEQNIRQITEQAD